MSERDEWLGLTDDQIETWMALFGLEKLGLVNIEHNEFGIIEVTMTYDGSEVDPYEL